MLSFILSNKYLAIAKWIAIAGCAWYIYHLGGVVRDHAELKQKLAQSIADHNSYIATRAKQDAITAKVSTDYENAIQDLTGQLDASRAANGHVRLCHNLPQTIPTSTAPSGPNETSQDRPSTETGSVVSTSELYQIAGEAASCGIQLNKLIQWVNDQYSLAKATGSP